MNVLIIFFKNNALNTYTGNSTRLFNVLQTLCNSNFNVSILHSIEARGFEKKSLREKCNVYYHKNFSRSFLKERFFTEINPFLIISLIKVLRKQKFDIIQFEYPYGFFLLKLLVRKQSFIILDTHNVECESLRILTHEKQIIKLTYPILKVLMRIYEKFACKIADLIVCVSKKDRNYFIKNYKIKREKTFLLPTPSSINLDLKLKRTIELKKELRKKLGLPLEKIIVMFHGEYNHFPNKEAFELIMNYISPNIENPKILFVLAGNNLEKFQKNNIISLGFVKNLKDLLYASDFAIIPTISGSGMAIKITDYIITALPFISTKKGMKGIDILKSGIDYLEYDDVDENFLSGINLLSNNNKLREILNRNLQKKSNFVNRENFGKQLIKLYLKLNNYIKF